MEKRQQELQFLGFFGIFKESFRIIFSKPKLFTQITLTFILPLSIIDAIHQYFSRSISSKHFVYSILLDIFLLPFEFNPLSPFYIRNRLRHYIPIHRKRCDLQEDQGHATEDVEASYDHFRIEFRHRFLLWKPYGKSRSLDDSASFFPNNIIRNLAATVSVIEDLSGIKAMIKSMNLIKGKIGVAVFMWLVLSYCFAVIDGKIIDIFLGPDRGLNWRNGIGIRIPCFILLGSMGNLLGLVVVTVIYFSCKSHEVTMRVLKTQSHQTNFKSIWWSVLDPLME
ncbi:hypothetical protein Pint_27350 [Pistacia integerrima]|uniref:Uncharacterized protein n=1 Tax=Pistacia integerrima TaxID=434235 RepID=A0ACC0YV86_9ROSI|nr:hypothetical protein Pint_27350 [Pistacia integerrima]